MYSTMKLENNWKYKSLKHLQKYIGDSKGENHPSNLVKRCAELMLVPLNEYTIEDLRIMIGQQVGLEYLVPFAIEKLQNDLFAEGDLYPGDLLSSVLKINPAFWNQNQNFQLQLRNMIENRKSEIINNQISLTLFESSL